MNDLRYVRCRRPSSVIPRPWELLPPCLRDVEPHYPLTAEQRQALRQLFATGKFKKGELAQLVGITTARLSRALRPERGGDG